MDITVLKTGFVTTDYDTPVAYSGEMNSRIINIVHPTFDNSFYQLLIVKENRPYVLGIQDGQLILPPSLIDIAGILECQFMAVRKNENINLASNSCDCYPESTNDCNHMIFKSDKFTLKVAEGLNIKGISPIPPYEQLVEIYNNISKAKLSVEQAKADNMQVVDTLDQKIKDLQSLGYVVELNHESKERMRKDKELEEQILKMSNNYKNKTQQFIDEYFEGNAIQDFDNNITLLSSLNISKTCTIPKELTLIIPKNITLYIDNDVKLNVEGNLIIGGIIDIGVMGNIVLTGTLKSNNFYNCIRYNETYEMSNEEIRSSGITIFPGASIETLSSTGEYYQLFGNDIFKLELGSYIYYTYDSNINKKMITLNGNICINNDLILNNKDIIYIVDTTYVNSKITLNDDSTILVRNYSNLVVNNEIIINDNGLILGSNIDSKLSIDELAMATGFESGNTYLYDNSNWIINF